ncbi:cytochrome c oxidase assembly protein [Streptomyces montanisoli]|uniref:Cytochrome c oxidase assembly protein n=1 Tax=Streptomyces montanisoli TaxID=2798581 RepID=A0A940M8W5_9ACTN|nr:cytochrome c oxidase assembly protein [Streptomyces montanisoli]MBP0456071.1 cytochrome c oxidase assembly protein [Streptomyces montanisoli]
MTPDTGYHGPPELTVSRMLTTWHPDPAVLLALAVIAAGYLMAVVTARRRGRAWPLRRSTAFAAALATTALVTVSFIGVYADTLFWVRAVQLTTLFMIVPLFAALTRPLTLAAALLPARHTARARSAFYSRPVRALAHPATGAVLFMGLPWVVFFTGWLPAMLQSRTVDIATAVLLVAVGFLYYWGRLQLDPVPSRYSPLVSLFVAFAEVLLNAVLGLLLIYAMGAGIAHGYYAGLNRPWGMSLSLDEQTGGGAYWVLGHAIGIPYLAIVFRRAVRHDQRAAAAIDATLDRHAPAHTREDASSEMMRPWWETDPAVAHLGLNTPRKVTGTAPRSPS